MSGAAAGRRLTSERLILRPLTGADADALHGLFAQPGVRRYLFDDEAPSRQQVDEMLQRSIELARSEGSGLWGISPRHGTELLGCAGYWYFHQPPVLELVYALGEAHWGHGFATEAAGTLLRYGHDVLGLRTVRASTDAPNTASMRVLERLAFTCVGRRPEHGRDTVFYEHEEAR